MWCSPKHRGPGSANDEATAIFDPKTGLIAAIERTTDIRVESLMELFDRFDVIQRRLSHGILRDSACYAINSTSLDFHGAALG